MPQFRKKPIVINAILCRDALKAVDTHWADLPQWLIDAYEKGGVVFTHTAVHLQTLEGPMVAGPNDWIICGVKGELYPCKPDIFAATYEDATEPNNTDAQTSAEEVREFQDDVRGMLLQELEKRGIKADIDGGGCDSGDWRDFTMSEIQQAFNRLADYLFEKTENSLGELDPVTICEHLRSRFAGLFVFMRGKEGDQISYHGGDLTGAKSRLAEACKSPA